MHKERCQDEAERESNRSNNNNKRKKTGRRSSFRIFKSLMGSRLFFFVKHLIGLLDRKKKSTTRATPTIALHSKQNHSEQLGLTDWQMTDVLLFQRLSEKKGATTYCRFFFVADTLSPALRFHLLLSKGFTVLAGWNFLSLPPPLPPFSSRIWTIASPPPIRLHPAEIRATTRQE